MIKLLRMFKISGRRKNKLAHDFVDAENLPRMAAGRDEIPTCCGCINIRFFLMFLFTTLMILAGIDLYRQGAFEFDRITFEIGFSWAVFLVSLIGALGTICESAVFMAIVTIAMLAVAFISLGYVVYITYVFYMVEDNVETLKEKKLLHPDVRKEDVDGDTYVVLALPHMLVMIVAFAISGLTCSLFDYYTD